MIAKKFFFLKSFLAIVQFLLDNNFLFSGFRGSFFFEKY